MEGWIWFSSFLAVWLGFTVWARRNKECSWTMAVGGGFLVGCVSILLTAVVILPMPSKTNKIPVPEKQMSANAQDHWFSGGTLHNAAVAQWRGATYANKLATAGDWLASTKWKGHLNTPEDFDRIKSRAATLVHAVDTVSEADKSGVSKASEIAAAIITMANDLGP